MKRGHLPPYLIGNFYKLAHTKSQGPKKKCTHFTRERIHSCPVDTARNKGSFTTIALWSVKSFNSPTVCMYTTHVTNNGLELSFFATLLFQISEKLQQKRLEQKKLGHIFPYSDLDEFKHNSDIWYKIQNMYFFGLFPSKICVLKSIFLKKGAKKDCCTKICRFCPISQLGQNLQIFMQRDFKLPSYKNGPKLEILKWTFKVKKRCKKQ